LWLNQVEILADLAEVDLADVAPVVIAALAAARAALVPATLRRTEVNQAAPELN